MRVIAAVSTFLLLLAVIGFKTPSQNDTGSPTTTAPAGRHWVKLTFGLDGKSAPWDGEVSIDEGRILQSAPWSFERRDRFG